MSDTKISGLPAAATLDGTESLPVVQSGSTKKATIGQVLADTQPLSVIGQAIQPIVVGQEFSSPCAGTGTFTFASGNARFAPVFVANETTIDRLSVNVTSAGSAGAVARLVVCADSGAFKPGAVIAQGTVDTTSIGLKSLAVAITLVPGVYWVAAVNQGTPATNATLTFIDRAGIALAHESQPSANSFAWQATIAGECPDAPVVSAFISAPRVLLRQGP